MRKPLVAGNWKMNGTRAVAAELVGAIVDGVSAGVPSDVLICPPFVLLDTVRARLAGSGVRLGAQSLAEHAAGAYTGETAGEMLVEAGCTDVIVGHSERRTLYGETDAVVAMKFLRAKACGLRPILCLGELLAEREAGNTEAVVARQLDAVLDAAGADAFAGAVLAYEPVWAIGTGKTASPAQAQAVHAFIRARLAMHGAALAAATLILYGGSVKGGNAAELFAEDDIDGGLIGGASLDAADFLTICRAGEP